MGRDKILVRGVSSKFCLVAGDPPPPSALPPSPPLKETLPGLILYIIWQSKDVQRSRGSLFYLFFEGASQNWNWRGKFDITLAYCEF